MVYLSCTATKILMSILHPLATQRVSKTATSITLQTHQYPEYQYFQVDATCRITIAPQYNLIVRIYDVSYTGNETVDVRINGGISHQSMYKRLKGDIEVYKTFKSADEELVVLIHFIASQQQTRPSVRIWIAVSGKLVQFEFIMD